MRDMKLAGIATALALCLCFAAPSVLAQDRVIATVDGRPITEADVTLAAGEIAVAADLAPEDRRRVLVEVLVERQVLAGAAEQARLHATPEFSQRIGYLRRALLQQALIEKRVREAVTEADARRVYEQEKSTMAPVEQVSLRQIVVAGEAKAKELRASLLKGADFAALARAESSDQRSAQRGGDLGWYTKGALPEKLGAAVFALSKKGDLTAPIETEAGWQIAQLEDRRVAVPEFAELKDHIIEVLVRSKSQELAAGLRQQAKVVYVDVGSRPDAVVAASPASARPPAAAAVPPVAAPGQNPVTTGAAWFHKAARVRLEAQGEQVQITFDAPTEALTRLGVRPGAVAFKGTRSGQSYIGEAYAFTAQCGARAFPVKGQASADQKRIELRGTAPNLGPGCNVSGSREELLVFRAAGG